MKRFYPWIFLVIAYSIALYVANAQAQTPMKEPPLAAIAVSQCGKAVALFVQLDATHLFRADPRQSDMFVAAPDGNYRSMQQQKVGPMDWKTAISLAESAAIQTHVVIPCTDGMQT